MNKVSSISDYFEVKYFNGPMRKLANESLKEKPYKFDPGEYYEETIEECVNRIMKRMVDSGVKLTDKLIEEEISFPIQNVLEVFKNQVKERLSKKVPEGNIQFQMEDEYDDVVGHDPNRENFGSDYGL